MNRVLYQLSYAAMGGQLTSPLYMMKFSLSSGKTNFFGNPFDEVVEFAILEKLCTFLSGRRSLHADGGGIPGLEPRQYVPGRWKLISSPWSA